MNPFSFGEVVAIAIAFSCLIACIIVGISLVAWVWSPFAWLRSTPTAIPRIRRHPWTISAWKGIAFWVIWCAIVSQWQVSEYARIRQEERRIAASDFRNAILVEPGMTCMCAGPVQVGVNMSSRQSAYGPVVLKNECVDGAALCKTPDGEKYLGDAWWFPDGRWAP
jgi:hypothetical protein